MIFAYQTSTPTSWISQAAQSACGSAGQDVFDHGGTKNSCRVCRIEVVVVEARVASPDPVDLIEFDVELMRPLNKPRRTRNAGPRERDQRGPIKTNSALAGNLI